MKANNIYTWDPNDEDAPLKGSPSVAYGLARTLAFKERSKSASSGLRILFGEAGRRSVPWGCLWYELDGKIYQFGSHIKGYPEALGPNGKGVNEKGLELLGKGLNGVMSVNDLDFKWVQDELDLSPLLTPAMIQNIREGIGRVLNGPVGSRIYQSRMRAKALGLPVREDSDNCTSFIGGEIGVQLGTDFHEHMPLKLFQRLKLMCGEGGPQGGLDCGLDQVLTVPEASLMSIFQEMAGPQVDLKDLTNPSEPLPNTISWESLVSRIL